MLSAERGMSAAAPERADEGNWVLSLTHFCMILLVCAESRHLVDPT